MNDMSFFNQTIGQLEQVEVDQFLEIMKQIRRWLDIIFADAAKKIKDASAICMIPECNQHTQNYCHLLQRNGILNNISDENH